MAATSIDVVSSTGKKVGSTELPADLFDVETNVPLIHQVVVAQRAAARQGTHDTKTRGEVAGGGRKPYKQKGTGRARQGSIRAPQFTGGGVVHGPTPRKYDQRTPKKMKAAALRGVLSDRARNGRLHVIDSFGIEGKPSTRAAVNTMNAISTRRRILVVVERHDDLAMLSLRNIPEVHLLVVDQLNTYDVVISDDVLFTQGALDAFIARAPRLVSADDVTPVTAPKAAPKAEATKAPAAAKTESTSAAAEAPAKKAAKAQAPAAFAAVTEEAPKAAPKAKATKATEAAASDKPAVSVTQRFPGAAAPLDGGEAPEGYLIKGNADSMKYHQPGGRWYDATIAEVWFRTAADAEAAGFVEAGSKASAEANKAAEEADK